MHEQIELSYHHVVAAKNDLYSPELFRRYSDLIKTDDCTFDPPLADKLPDVQNLSYNLQVSENLIFLPRVYVEESWTLVDNEIIGSVSIPYGKFAIHLAIIENPPSPIHLSVSARWIDQSLIPGWLLGIIVKNTLKNLRKILNSNRNV